MISEYRLFHGAVFSELIGGSRSGIKFQLLDRSGRDTAYILNDSVGLQIKHSARKLGPWSFTFTEQNQSETIRLRDMCLMSFLVLVCHTAGMVLLSIEDVSDVLEETPKSAWLRAERRPGKWFEVSSSSGLAIKRPAGLDKLRAEIESAS